MTQLKELKKKVNILSLFDGISCGQVAINRLNINNYNYYASEIDHNAIKVCYKNYPNTIQLGDVRNLGINNLPNNVDLLMGGSPCQSFSFAGKKIGMRTVSNFEIFSLDEYLNLKNDGIEFEGQSYLFWEYVRVLNITKPKYFLLENVIMNKKWEKIITETLLCEPIEINSNLVSAQNRRRLYWTNIPNVNQPKNHGITIRDIIFDNTYRTFTDERITNTKIKTKNYVQWDLSGKGYKSQNDRAYYLDGKMCSLVRTNASSKLNIMLDYDSDLYRRLSPIEGERCQNMPDNYTDLGLINGKSVISDNQRLSLLGNGWTVNIITHILKNIKL